MKICIPTDDGRGLESTVCGHFGSAPWFTIVDTETGAVESEENPDCGSRPGACHHVGIMSRRGVEMVVSGGMGRRAVEGLADAGIRVMVARARSVAEVVEMARSGKLEPMQFDAACSGGFRRGQGQRERLGLGRGRGQGHGHAHRGGCGHD